MNVCRISSLVLAGIMLSAAALSQDNVQPDSLGLPGDNLNLYAVLKVFQESPTLEEFEKKLNAEGSMINNLDLDGDGNTDYIRVHDNVSDSDSVHTIVLQVAVSKDEVQDVAVIMVDRDPSGEVYVQVIGDEDLYGPGYVIEPRYETAGKQVGTPNPAYQGATSDDNVVFEGQPVVVRRTTPVVVARWPVVEFIYLPAYRPWRSPWYFGYYPSWWRPWRPIFWHEYWGYHYPYFHYYFGHYHRWNQYHRYQAHMRYAASIRASSHVVVERRRVGAFRYTYSRPELMRKGIERGRAVRREERPAALRRERIKPGVERRVREPRVVPGGMREGTRRFDRDKVKIVRPERKVGGVGMKKPSIGRPERKTPPAATRPTSRDARKSRTK
jgi:hypothetical protein